MSENSEEVSIKSFHTKMEVILDISQLRKAYQNQRDRILTKMDEFQMRDSGWALIRILHLEININKYQPLRGSMTLDFNYILIKNLSRLLRKQITSHGHEVHICNFCLIHFHTKIN
ncbi:hypothetical protein NQ317_001537 [Molorchus minor]|uniref:Uncharacterized protein n=1 Tax=Molorchus minor TaxID=1323400 RepID=A0ABQ9JQH6_9CUCU|nr:hypothetical protein NQ317_001537 [Molorchus minor]